MGNEMSREIRRREILEQLQKKSNSEYMNNTTTTAIQQIFREDALTQLKEIELEPLEEDKIYKTIQDNVYLTPPYTRQISNLIVQKFGKPTISRERLVEIILKTLEENPMKSILDELPIFMSKILPNKVADAIIKELEK